MHSSEEEAEPNKLQEAVDRINRFILYVRSHLAYTATVHLRPRVLGRCGASRRRKDCLDASANASEDPLEEHKQSLDETEVASSAGKNAGKYEESTDEEKEETGT